MAAGESVASQAAPDGLDGMPAGVLQPAGAHVPADNLNVAAASAPPIEAPPIATITHAIDQISILRARLVSWLTGSSRGV
jgi:hypothetical protein